MLGCQFQRPPDVSPDAGPIDAPTDARPDLVTGRRTTTYRTLIADETVPVDLSAAVVQALIPDESQASGFRTIDGTGNADGTFQLVGVEPGIEYYLKIDDRYWVTSAHAIELHDELAARRDVSRTTIPTAVTVDLAGLAPVRNGSAEHDLLGLRSSIAGLYAEWTAGEGATVSSTTLDWATTADGAGAPLPDTEAGDDLVAFQWRDRNDTSVRGASERRLVAATALSGVRLTAGVAATITATMPTAPPARMLVRFSRTGFDAVYDGDSYVIAAGDAVAAAPVLALPRTDRDLVGIATAGPQYFPASIELRYRGVHTSAITSDLDFPDVLPAAWPRIFVRYYTRVRRAVMPGATAGAQVPGGIMAIAPWTPGVAPAMGPPLSPPGNVTIGGVDAAGGGAIRKSGNAPVEVAWSPSARASQYQVTVYRAQNEGLRTIVLPVATLTTRGSSVRVPAEALGAGEFFAFSIAAIDSLNAYQDGDLLVRGVPLTFAAFPSGMFRIGATCGNGTVDPGEACDGPSASCDVDCTAPACGDGLTNLEAGESCDAGGAAADSPACDRDCTPNVCGDNRINSATEDCDDGNATNDNNGCSNTCLFNNVCGDGVRQVYGEACDTAGDSASCDSDCTANTCGDGHVNSETEQCDDGGTAPGDGCSATCTTE